MQDEADTRDCPAGRICRTSTSVASQRELSSCGSLDPNHCVVGDVCPSNHFCPIGTTEVNEKNSCGDLESFSGARERFFCKIKESKEFLLILLFFKIFQTVFYS